MKTYIQTKNVNQINKNTSIFQKEPAEQETNRQAKDKPASLGDGSQVPNGLSGGGLSPSWLGKTVVFSCVFHVFSQGLRVLETRKVVLFGEHVSETMGKQCVFFLRFQTFLFLFFSLRLYNLPARGQRGGFIEAKSE